MDLQLLKPEQLESVAERYEEDMVPAGRIQGLQDEHSQIV